MSIYTKEELDPIKCDECNTVEYYNKWVSPGEERVICLCCQEQEDTITFHKNKLIESFKAQWCSCGANKETDQEVCKDCK